MESLHVKKEPEFFELPPLALAGEAAEDVGEGGALEEKEKVCFHLF